MEQWIADMEGQMASEDLGKDLISVNILIKKHAVRIYWKEVSSAGSKCRGWKFNVQCTCSGTHMELISSC